MFKLSENMFKSILFYTFLIGIGFSGVSCEDKTIPSVRGETITLTCPIDITSCGELHSVKWFKGNERVAVVSGDGEVANVEGGYSDRMSIDHSPTGPETRLRLSNIQISDEETYLCESTFLDPMESCDSSGAYSIDLKVLVPPEEIIVLDHKGNTLTNGSVLGPLRVGQTLTATCEAKRARPEPTVGWYRAGKKLSDSFEIDQSEGLYNIKSELKLVLAREDLGSVIECRIETPALENIYTNQMMLDIQVSPTKIQLSGFKHHTVQGNKVLLHCQVVGARPPANVTWYNGTQIIDPLQSEPANIKTEMYPQSDRTYETVSQLIFTASRYENMISLKCIADNIVIRDNHEEPLHSGITLEVMYLPVVTVSPDSRTVNETSEVILFCNYDSNPASLTKVKWYKNDMPINANQSRYNGGHPELPALIIKNATKDDIGNYTCELANSVGQSISENQIELDVHYVPIVELIMSPDVPIIENDKGNVTLNCHVIDGNPTKLIKVKWFLDGTLLKELPECYDDNSTSCNFESNVIFLTNVDRTFKGNYSCEGHNSAGLGPRSDDSELIVYYEPGVASISHFPTIPVKRKSVTFECNVTDYGNPIATRYRWLRGGKSVLDVISKMWAVDPVLLDTRTNFSCFAYNEGGDGEAATVALDVHAPPAFIQKLPPYVGFLYSDSIINLTCRIECVPTCSISWFKDGLAIEDSNEKYYIKESYLPARNETGDFEGVLSILYFNMTAWPDERLDIFRDNGNYSCASSNNSIGRGVSSDTYFGVEYPPENTTSEAVVEIQEGSMLPSVICKAKAYPPPQFEWRHNDEILATSSALIINKEFYRKDSGTYNCISHNRHGSLTSDTYVNVTYKPDCKIERREIDNEDVLVCTAEANPLVVDFAWSVKSENDTIENLNVRENGHQGFLILDHDFSVMRTYRCVANNSVGLGTSCEIIVEVEPLCCTTVRPKRHLPWWQRWDLTTLIIVITSVVAILLAVLIVCCIIICICRKRRRQDKYPVKSSMAEDPLTEPGAYENLPFHGLQSAPNKHEHDGIKNKGSDTYIF